LFSPGTLVSSTNKTDRHDITEILLKVELNTITLTVTPYTQFKYKDIKMERYNVIKRLIQVYYTRKS
jgi:hypothetical protein